MLPRRNRLPRSTFSAARSHGRMFHGGVLSVAIAPGRDRSRFSVVVSKKVSRSAVKRHRIRRRLYGVLECITPELSEPVHAIVFARDGVTGATNVALFDELHAQFKKAGVLRPH